MNHVDSIVQAIKQMDGYLHDQLQEKKKQWEHIFIQFQNTKRKSGGTFSIHDHIRAMVYSFLSAGISWERMESGIDLVTGRILSIDEVFHQYDPEYLLQCRPEELRDQVKHLGYASQYTRKQMTALVGTNIGKLQQLDEQYGGIDVYYHQLTDKGPSFKTLVRTLSTPKSKDKMAQMGVALVCEYLRNVGYDIPKPDRHVRRILGSERLGCSEHKIVPEFDIFDIIAELAEELGKPAAEVDYILWSYCAKGYGEICTANPKCEQCVVKGYCANKR